MTTRGIHVALLLWLLIIKHVKTDGKLDIRFISYWSDGTKITGDCCDNGFPTRCPDKCDPMFLLCIDGPDGGKPCSLYKSITDYTDNHNIIHFGSSIQGTPNPFVMHAPKAVPSAIMIRVEVYDYDVTPSYDHMDTLSKLINIQAAATEQSAMYTSYTLRSRTLLKIWVRAYCDPYWFGSACEKYCKATTEHSHDTCHPDTGAKVCLEGWKGDNCNQDIDECTQIYSLCQNGGSCTNTLGNFECVCVEGIRGRRCENITTQCAREPCLNGGTCDGNQQAFSCACSVEWTGETCAEKVNFCDSAPCNRGNCTPDILTATGFKCKCDFGWIGDRCSLSVDIINITLLGEIDHTNRGDLADGLNRLTTELGDIPRKVDVRFTTNSRRENKERSEEVTDDDQIGLFVINVPCNRNLNRADSVTSFCQDASFCLEGDTSLDFDEVQVVRLDTVCDEISNTQPTTEDVTLDPLSIQGSSVSENARLSDVATPGTRRHVTSLDPEGLPSAIVSPDDHARLGDFGTPDTHDHVTSYTPLGVLPCTSGGGLPQTNSYDPLNRYEEEDAECAMLIM